MSTKPGRFINLGLAAILGAAIAAPPMPSALAAPDFTPRTMGARRGGKRYPHSSEREWKRFGRQAARGQLRPENGLEAP